MLRRILFFNICLLFLLISCNKVEDVPIIPRLNEPSGFSKELSEAALERTNHNVRYDPAYRKIEYPGGDVPDNIGVCTDLIIRGYRALGIDLQKDVHEEMVAHFSTFSKRWGLESPDPNIDHRRVPNLQVLFERKGEKFAVTHNPENFTPGDLVIWDVSGRPHIGIVVNRKIRGRDRYMVVHNIGRGPVLEDILFKYPITGHYRYYGSYRSKTEKEGG